MRNLSIVLCALSLIGASPAFAGDLCKQHGDSKWMSKDEITAKVRALGYEVRKIQLEDGCWEVKGMKEGKRVEAYFDPVSAELVLTK